MNRKLKHRIFTSKFTTLWTENTCRLNLHFRHTITTYTSRAICTLTTTIPGSLHPHITHHQNPINHKTFNIHLFKQMLTCLLSLPFQMKNNSVYPNQQMVVRQSAVNNSRGSKMNTFVSTATSWAT